MSYTVFARKYRPQTFDDVVGQQHITQTLKNAILQNRLAHAYLFVGPRGTGKTSTARILAKALNCHQSPGPTLTPCGVCDSCIEITAGNSMDVLEFDAASNTQVDKVRDIIIDNVKYLPARSRFKVYLVDEVHMLSTGSFNALLKTLEEPPAHVKFLFATTDVQKLPATILSRCQRFDLKRIGAPVIASHLLHIAAQEGVALAPEAALAVAIGADGGMRDAESMLDQLVAFCGDSIGEHDVLSVFGFTSRQTVSDLCTAVLAQEAPEALRIVHEQAEAGRDLLQLLADLIGHLRNLLLAQADPAGIEAELGRPVLEALQTQCAGIEREKVLELIDLFAASEQRMKWASNKQMHLEVALLRAIQTVGQATLDEVLQALAALRGGGALPERAAAPKPQKVQLPSRPVEIPRRAEPVNAPAPAPAPVIKPAAQPAPAPAAPVAAAPSTTPVAASPAPSATVQAPELVAEVPHAESEGPVSAPNAASPDIFSGELELAPQLDLAPKKTRAPKKEPAARKAKTEPSSPVPESDALGFASREVPPEVVPPAAPAPEPVQAQAPRVEAPPAASVTETPKVEETKPVPPPAAAPVSEASLSVEQLWPELVQLVRKERSFISLWLEAGVLESIEGSIAVLALPEDQSLIAEYLTQEGNRSFLEKMLHKLTDKHLRVRIEVRQSVERRPVAHPEEAAPEAAKDPMEEFKNDPLIRKALEIFKARLEAV